MLCTFGLVLAPAANTFGFYLLWSDSGGGSRFQKIFAASVGACGKEYMPLLIDCSGKKVFFTSGIFSARELVSMFQSVSRYVVRCGDDDDDDDDDDDVLGLFGLCLGDV